MAGTSQQPGPVETGCLLLADISGYTSYLRESELDHAHDALRDLLETVVGGLQPVFEIVELEGDAVFAYAPSGSVHGSLALDAVDRAYFAFRSRLRDVSRATTCECRACRLLPSLDLKFVVHDGTFARHEIADRVKLTGTDVVVLHRLLKNTVKEDVGTDAYLLLTRRCVEGMYLDPAALDMTEHVEHIEDVGTVHGFVMDLSSRWALEQERRRVFVLPDEAQVEVRQRFAADPETLWEYMTDPAKRMLWQTDFDSIDLTDPGGRRGSGSVAHCAHGNTVIREETLDWRPFHYFTQRITMPMVGKWVHTFEFLPDPQEGGTVVSHRAERLRGWRRVLWLLLRRSMARGMRRNLEALEAHLTKAEPLRSSS